MYKSKYTGEEIENLLEKTENMETYVLPQASSTAMGGIKIGYTTTGKNYPVLLNTSGQAYVNVPWINTNTTYSVATTTANGLMPQLPSTDITTDMTFAPAMQVLTGDGKWKALPLDYNPITRNLSLSLFDSSGGYGNSSTELPLATSSQAGLMSADDKTKLDNNLYDWSSEERKIILYSKRYWLCGSAVTTPVVCKVLCAIGYILRVMFVFQLDNEYSMVGLYLCSPTSPYTPITDSFMYARPNASEQVAFTVDIPHYTAISSLTTQYLYNLEFF